MLEKYIRVGMKSVLAFKHFQDPDFIPKMETVLKRPSFYQLYQSENRVSPPLTHSTAGYESRSSAL